VSDYNGPNVRIQGVPYFRGILIKAWTAQIGMVAVGIASIVRAAAGDLNLGLATIILCVFGICIMFIETRKDHYRKCLDFLRDMREYVDECVLVVTEDKPDE